MDADIRIIRLSRMTVEGKRCQDLQKGDCWFVTDYFDLMQVNSLSMKQPFAEWLDIRKNSVDDYEIAAQSYTLYCSAAMLEQYENLSEMEYRKDPFTKEDGLECLSIIQVYITPEVLARMKDGVDKIHGDNGIILPSFVEDLYETLDIFSTNYPDDIFAARVYMMLSAGDFAIVVRSRKPDTAHHISTYLRKRRAGKAEVSCADDAYVLYKTYTLSTIGRQIIRCEEGQNKTQDAFVLRGCYSNIYWREQDKVQEFLRKLEGEVKEFYPISGRYDFTAHLTEEEFYQVMFFLTEGKAVEEESGSELVQYLKFLINGDYLSYINERYLMAKMEEPSDFDEQEMVSKSVFLWKKEENVKELFEQNKYQIEKLLEKQNTIAEESRSILGYRKNIQQYLFLLKREISLCKSINELSDTRIYAKVLVEQLETVLDSAERYISACSRSEDNDIWIDVLEDHLRKAALTLDSFAQYIRNNNLQSLQTPNYNIETSMGVEKVLIGYSELLWSFIELYKQSMPSATSKAYLPVMIPNLHDRDVNVDVLFPVEEFPNAEAKAIDSASDSKCLMVIGSPTLEEVTDFPIMFPPLFHEVAHQFRYEERKVRNQAVLKATTKEIMHEVAKYITKVVNEKIGATSEDGGILCTGLTDGLTQAFIDIKYPDSRSDELKEKSLAKFQDDLFTDINQLFQVWLWKSDLKTRIQEFTSELRYVLVPWDEEIREQLVELHKSVIEEFEDIDRVAEHAFYLAGACANYYLDETSKDKWNLEKTSESDDLWELKWKRVFDGIEQKDIQRIDRAYSLLVSWMDGYKEQFKKLGDFDKDEWKEAKEEAGSFETKLFTYMRDYWKEIGQQSSTVYSSEKEEKTDIIQIPSYHYWTHVGRCLGLDYGESGRERFTKELKEALAWQNLDIESSILALYREETADLLMCNVMQMSPLGYLNLAVSLFTPRNGFYCGTDMERAFCVLYVQWCYAQGQDKEEAWKKYRQIYCKVYEDARENSRKVLNEVDIIRLPEDASSEQISFEDDENSREKAEAVINEDAEYLRKCCSEIQKLPDKHKKERILGELENTIRLYNLLIDLIRNSKHFWLKLHDDEKMLEDMASGRLQLAELREKANEYHSGVINEIFEVGNLVSEYLLHSYSQKGMGESEELNRKGVELLLTMYYQNKIRIAQGKREEDTNED